MRDYACIMIDYNQPDFIKQIQKRISKKDIYLGETQEDIDTNQYGIENECHITICYGLENDVKFDDFKKYLFPLNEYKTILINISLFENDLFDVLKVDAKCPKASESNKLIRDNFDVHTDFNEYHAHMTIGYLKKGRGKKYTKKLLDKIDVLTPIRFNYSYSKNGKNINELYDNL